MHESGTEKFTQTLAKQQPLLAGKPGCAARWDKALKGWAQHTGHPVRRTQALHGNCHHTTRNINTGTSCKEPDAILTLPGTSAQGHRDSTVPLWDRRTGAIVRLVPHNDTRKLDTTSCEGGRQAGPAEGTGKTQIPSSCTPRA